MAAPQLGEKKTVTLTIQEATKNGSVWAIKTAKSDGTVVELKMLDGLYSKAPDDFAPGKTGPYVIEQKEYRGEKSWYLLWADKPKSGGGYKGGGGPAKSDPAKNAVIEKANTRNNDTINECNIRNSITALAVAGATTIGDEAKDANALRAWVQDVHSFVEDMVREANHG